MSDVLFTIRSRKLAEPVSVEFVEADGSTRVVKFVSPGLEAMDRVASQAGTRQAKVSKHIFGMLSAAAQAAGESDVTEAWLSERLGTDAMPVIEALMGKLFPNAQVEDAEVEPVEDDAEE